MVEIEDIYKLEVYNNLISVGAKVLVGKTIGNPNELLVAIEHSRFRSQPDNRLPYIFDNLILYQNGYVQYKLDDLIISHSGAIKGEELHVMNINEWDARLSKIFDDIFRYILITKMNLEESIYFYLIRNKTSLYSKLNYLLDNNKENLFRWVNELDIETAGKIIDILSDNIILLINSEPTRSSILLKNIYNNPSFLKLLPKVDSENITIFKKDINLLGDLNSLGL